MKISMVDILFVLGWLAVVIGVGLADIALALIIGGSILLFVSIMAMMFRSGQRPKKRGEKG